MVKIKIKDSMFAHVKYSTLFQTSKYIEWDRHLNSDLCIYTDSHIFHVQNKGVNIGWLLESPEITNLSYKWMKKNYEKFDYVLTFDKELLESSDKFLMCPIGGCWIKPEQQKIYTKSKNISIISSSKKITNGHKMRHDVISQIPNIDIYGRGYNQVENKLTALKDYRYNVVIENTKKDYYFTEKLIDSFMTGTIPIYYGCPSISNFFDTRGMIIIDNIDDLKMKMSNLTEDNFNSMKEFIKINFEKAKSFLIAEDIIYKLLKNKEII